MRHVDSTYIHAKVLVSEWVSEWVSEGEGKAGQYHENTLLT
jgi:hypothetical protein